MTNERLNSATKRTSGLLTVALVITVALLAPAKAIDSVILKVGVPVGGTTDIVGRIVANHIGRFLEGAPSVVVENVPGAAGFLLRTNLRNSEPNDGTVVAITTLSQTLSAMLEPERFGFEGADVRWIGSLSNEPGACMVSESSGIETIDDLLSQPIQLGAPTVASNTYREAAMIRTLFGAQFEIVTGFTGGAELVLAVTRGEIAGACGVSLYSFLASAFSDGKRVLGYFGPEPAIDGNFFAFADMIDNELDRQAVEFLTAPKRTLYSLALPPNTPDDILDSYRQAFDQMVVDPAFLEDIATLVSVFTPRDGPEVEAIADAILSTPGEIVDRARELVR